LNELSENIHILRHQIYSIFEFWSSFKDIPIQNETVPHQTEQIRPVISQINNENILNSNIQLISTDNNNSTSDQNLFLRIANRSKQIKETLSQIDQLIDKYPKIETNQN